MFYENDAHFGHLLFLGELQGNGQGLLLYYSTHIPGAIRKISACRELFQTHRGECSKMPTLRKIAHAKKNSSLLNATEVHICIQCKD